MTRFFISYRRNDVPGVAVSLARALKQRLGDDRVFLDSESIRAGDDFAHRILEALKACEIVLVLAGSNWLDRDPSGTPRIFDEHDYVRMELAVAKHRPIVVPILVDGISIPREQDLPAELSWLSRRQALRFVSSAGADALDALVDALLVLDKDHVSDPKPEFPVPTAAEYFETVLPRLFERKNPLDIALFVEVRRTIVFEVDNGQTGVWSLVCMPPHPRVEKGRVGAPDLTLAMTSAVLSDMLSGKFVAKEAVADGGLRFSGDISLLKHIGFFFQP